VKSFLEGKPVVVLAPIFQHSPEVLLSLDPRARTPSDVAKLGSIGLQPGDESLDLKAMFVNEGIALDKLNINTQANGLDDLLAGKIIAMNAFLSNEPWLLQKRGIPYTVIDPDQYGMDFYNGVLFSSLQATRKNPEQAAAFLSASLKGWEYALANQDEIIGLILAKYNTQAKSRDYLVFEAKTLAELIQSDVIHLGHSNLLRWKSIVDTYAKFGIIRFGYSLDGFIFDPRPPAQDRTWLYRLLAIVILVGSLVAVVAAYIGRLHVRLRHASHVVQTALEEQHQFMEMLTHELAEPIAAVGLTLEDLTGQEIQKNRAMQALDDMSSIVERCQQLDQLEHQTPSLQFQVCQLAELLQALRGRSHAPERIVLDHDINSVADVRSDQQLLGIVLSNLLSNALKYSPPQSLITVNAQALTQQDVPGVQVSVQNFPGAAGLPDSGKVFEKYYRSPGAQKQTGSGLGLYLVHRFTELLGGSIRFETANGKVFFILWIPC
jgi:signal transduction histidine kinase